MYIVVAYVGGVETAAMTANDCNYAVHLMKHKFGHYGNMLKIKTQKI